MSVSLEQATALVSEIAKKEAERYGIAPDTFQIILVPDLVNSLRVELGLGPTIQVMLRWPDSGPILRSQLRAVFKLLLKQHRTQYQLVPIAFVQKETEREKKMKRAWEKGKVWIDMSQKVAGLIPSERVRVEVTTVCRYTDVITGTFIEKTTHYTRFNVPEESINGWLELSALVREQHPESIESEDDEDAGADDAATTEQRRGTAEQTPDVLEGSADGVWVGDRVADDDPGRGQGVGEYPERGASEL